MLVNRENLGLQCLCQIKAESVWGKTMEIRRHLVLKSSMTARGEKMTFWQFLGKMQLMGITQALSTVPRISSMQVWKDKALCMLQGSEIPCASSSAIIPSLHHSRLFREDGKSCFLFLSTRIKGYRQSSLVSQSPAFYCKTVLVCAYRFSAKLCLCFGQGWRRGISSHPAWGWSGTVG